jgi:hypothetical protein
MDLMRKDGKFVGVDGSIPEGQGIVMAHLNECHELLEMVSSIRTGCLSAAEDLDSYERPWMRVMKNTMKTRTKTRRT